MSNKVLFVINGMVRNDGVVSVSGGDVRLMEIVRNTPESYQKYLLSTANGKEFLSKSLGDTFNDTYLISHELSAGIVSGLGIVVKSWFIGGTGAAKYRDGLVYSSCEHLYDVLPALRLKMFNNCKWYAVYHWVEDYPWREKRGNTPLVPRYAYWLQRFIAGLLIKWFSDRVLAVSEPTKDKLVSMKGVNSDKIKAVYCGVNYDEIRTIVKKYKSETGSKYDAVYMKRLNYGKGVIDLLEIWKKVVATKKDAKLAIIGDGSPEVIAQISEYLDANGLANNVDLLGVIYDTEEKFRVINSAKVFLLPTHEENWAIVIGEAMAAGVPVVVSKLKEITPIWKDNVVWCEVGDTSAFAKETLALIEDNSKSAIISKKALEFIPVYDWKNIGNDELN